MKVRLFVNVWSRKCFLLHNFQKIIRIKLQGESHFWVLCAVMSKLLQRTSNYLPKSTFKEAETEEEIGSNKKLVHSHDELTYWRGWCGDAETNATVAPALVWKYLLTYLTYIGTITAQPAWELHRRFLTFRWKFKMGLVLRLKLVVLK